MIFLCISDQLLDHSSAAIQILLAESCASTCRGSCLQDRYPGDREEFQKLILVCLDFWREDLEKIPWNTHRLKWEGGGKHVAFMPEKAKQENRGCQLWTLWTTFCHPLKYMSSCYYGHPGNPRREANSRNWMNAVETHLQQKVEYKSWRQDNQSLILLLLLMHCLIL